MKKKYVVSCDYDSKKVYLYDSWPQLNMVNFTDDINKAYCYDLKFNAKYRSLLLKCNGYDAKVEEVTVEEENRQDKTMWVSRDKDDNRLWLHPHSKPVLHTYTDYEGVEHKRYDTDTLDEFIGKEGKQINYGDLYEHLCSAQYIADVLQDEHTDQIMTIRQEVGEKLLKIHEDNAKC